MCFCVMIVGILVVGAADAPLIGANVKPTDVSTQKSTRPVPKVPSSNAATVMSVTMEPTTPAKGTASWCLIYFQFP